MKRDKEDKRYMIMGKEGIHFTVGVAIPPIVVVVLVVVVVVDVVVGKPPEPE
jgi:uncharacterized Tic20 family protein